MAPAGYPGAPSTQTVSDFLATIAPAPAVGNVAGFYVWLVDGYGNVFGPSGVTGANGAWSIPAVPDGIYSSFYGTSPSNWSAKGATPYIVDLHPGVWFADGSDGALVFDGVASPVGGATLAASTYTLQRDVFASSIVINAGIIVKTGGYRIYCTGTLTNNGTIAADGNAAVGATGGIGVDQSGSTMLGGFVGVNGPAGVTTAAAGAAAANTSYSPGGSGGNGGSSVGGANPGGAGGVGSALSVTLAKGTIRQPASAQIGWRVSANPLAAGENGGAGAGDGTNAGGGGGSGGGGMMIAARVLNNLGAIHARGGAGGAAAGGNAGGGGGGGGGYITLMYTYLTLGAVDCNGGAAGASSGTGGAAQAGQAGTIIQLQV